MCIVKCRTFNVLIPKTAANSHVYMDTIVIIISCSLRGNIGRDPFIMIIVMIEKLWNVLSVFINTLFSLLVIDIEHVNKLIIILKCLSERTFFPSIEWDFIDIFWRYWMLLCYISVQLSMKSDEYMKNKNYHGIMRLVNRKENFQVFSSNAFKVRALWHRNIFENLTDNNRWCRWI